MAENLAPPPGHPARDMAAAGLEYLRSIPEEQRHAQLEAILSEVTRRLTIGVTRMNSPSPFTKLSDDLLRAVLAYLPHNGGKARFARTGRQARDAHATTIPDGFGAWVMELSAKQQRWISGLCVAPPIRAGFESGVECRERPFDVMRAAGQSDDAIGRLVAYQASLVEEEREMEQRVEEGEIEDTDEDSFEHYLAEEDINCDELENQMSELPAVFIALGFLGESRINELLAAKLGSCRWAAVFDYRREDIVNTILIDPLFSFARWGEAIVTGRYEMMAMLNHGGWALGLASAELKGDRIVVAVAVR